jgi:uncharacterized protein YkwD
MTTRRRPRTTLVAMIAVLAATLAILGATTAPAQAKLTLTQIQAMDADTYEVQVHTLINQQRAKRGLRKLRYDSCADGFSERWAQHLADSGRFYHQSLSPILNQCRARYAGEVIGRGYWSPGQMVRAWMKSTPHRRILLKGKPNKLGVGAVLDSQGRWVLTANTVKRR